MSPEEFRRIRGDYCVRTLHQRFGRVDIYRRFDGLWGIQIWSPPPGARESRNLSLTSWGRTVFEALDIMEARTA